MANKFTLIAVVIIATTAMGVGAFVGTQLPSSADTVTNVTSTPTPVPSATETGTAEATPTGTATATPTATPRPTVSPEEFDAARIEAEVLAAVNAEREERGLDPLSSDSRLDPMAQFHSGNMADQGYVSHAANGYTTSDRYEKFDQADRCRVPNDARGGIVTKQNLETLALGFAGRPYEDDNETRIDRNESAVARAVVDDWFEDDRDAEVLTLENAGYAGVGANVTDSGRVFVTVDLC
jgi:uncharacterized protein YkwD